MPLQQINRVTLAPLSNDYWRDWPITNYKTLARLLLVEGVGLIDIIGSKRQKSQLLKAFDGLPHSVQVSAGKTPWIELPKVLRSSDLVIGNNSGIAHLANSLKIPAIVIFGGSVSVEEWGPRGATTMIVSTELSCSPCANPSGCPYDKRCLREIRPRHIVSVIQELDRRSTERK